MKNTLYVSYMLQQCIYLINYKILRHYVLKDASFNDLILYSLIKKITKNSVNNKHHHVLSFDDSC